MEQNEVSNLGLKFIHVDQKQNLMLKMTEV